VSGPTEEQASSDAQTLDVRVAGVDCDNDASRLKASLERLPGVLVVEVWASPARLRASLSIVPTKALSRAAIRGSHTTRSAKLGPGGRWRLEGIASLVEGDDFLTYLAKPYPTSKLLELLATFLDR
tara:strand:- start:2398 stop:2775 length:378 start_codon:yes stop_codon:yes gene_type:complete